jgi:hypothetical protein
MDLPKILTAFLGHLRIIHLPNEKLRIADRLQIYFTCHDMCDEIHERRVETGIQALLAPVYDTLMGNFRHQSVNLLRKVCGLDGVPN